MKSKTPPKAGPSIYVRDNRRPGWFWAENELVDVFAPLVGPYALAVFVTILRLCQGNSALVEVSVRDIERAWKHKDFRASLSRSSITRALSQLLAAGLLRLSREGTRSRPAEYLVGDLRDLAASLTVEQRENLLVRLEGQRDRCVPQGDTPNFHSDLRKSCGKACGKDQLSTEIPGTHVSPRGTYVSPTGTLSIKDSKTINTPPTPSAGGGEENDSSVPDLRAPKLAWDACLGKVRAHLLAAAPTVHRGGRDPLADWKVFEEIALVGYFRDRAGLVLHLSSPCPGDAREALAHYSRTRNMVLHVALRQAFEEPVSGLKVSFRTCTDASQEGAA